MKCPGCGAESAGPFCPVCGTKIKASTTCTDCGMEFTGRYCPFCGTPANKAEERRQQPEYEQQEYTQEEPRQQAYQQREYTRKEPRQQAYQQREYTREEPQQQAYRQQEYTREEPRQQAYRQPPIIINNTQSAVYDKRAKNKWVSFFLCLFLGGIGVHKFYEGRIGMGLLYLFTGGLLGIGVLIDLITLLFKPTYYLP